MYGRPPTSSALNRPLTRATGAPGMPPATGSAASGGAQFGAARPTTGFRMVVDRPVTQQGLSGLKTSAGGQGRMVQDASYWTSFLRQRQSLINAEIRKMQVDIADYERDKENAQAFEQKSTSLAAELRDYQGQLGDYNTLLDKMNTDTDVEQIEQQLRQLQAKNQQERAKVEDLFRVRREKEQAVAELQKQLDDENALAEQRIKELPQAERDEYEALKKENQQHIDRITDQQRQLEGVADVVLRMQEDLARNPDKQRVIALNEQLSELCAREREVASEIREKQEVSGPEERERLLQRVKDDNQEIATMERRIVELEEANRRMAVQMASVEEQILTNQNEKSEKFEVLAKRDEEMRQFLDTFDTAKAECLAQKQAAQAEIARLLDQFHKFTEMQLDEDSLVKGNGGEAVLHGVGDWQRKEADISAGKLTLDQLLIERDRCQQDWERLTQLEAKMQSDLTHAQEKSFQLRDELQRFANVDRLKKEAQMHHRSLIENQERLQRERKDVTERNAASAKELEILRAKLAENDTHVQLTSMEQRIGHLESNNFFLREQIKAKLQETDCTSVVRDLRRLAGEYNGILEKNLASPLKRA